MSLLCTLIRQPLTPISAVIPQLIISSSWNCSTGQICLKNEVVSDTAFVRQEFSYQCVGVLSDSPIHAHTYIRTCTFTLISCIDGFFQCIHTIICSHIKSYSMRSVISVTDSKSSSFMVAMVLIFKQ